MDLVSLIPKQIQFGSLFVLKPNSDAANVTLHCFGDVTEKKLLGKLFITQLARVFAWKRLGGGPYPSKSIILKTEKTKKWSLKEISSELTIRGRYEEEAIVRCTSSAVDRYRKEAPTIEDYDRSMYIMYHRSMSRCEMRDLVHTQQYQKNQGQTPAILRRSWSFGTHDPQRPTFHITRRSGFHVDRHPTFIIDRYTLEPDGHARAMDGRILQVSGEDIADILQLANGPDNLFMKQHSIPDNIPAVPDEHQKADTTEIGSHQLCQPVGQTSIDKDALTLFDEAPSPSIDIRYECGRRAYDIYGARKFRWEQKDEYGVYRDESGYARSVAGEMIPITKDNIRKILERASLFKESHICLPEHATSFTPTKLAPEIYTKNEINEMVTGFVELRKN
ncbi:hypothetical protein F2Q68_00015971 [Brassica cretica]|uniref:Uncharacterized protein n=1 Tax=Brassica cretica TaxID=69181 RepID=A0A8S9HRP5_BRACR|nr:hypothetical protein F2Q68_00015971 [Brassica cretica]